MHSVYLTDYFILFLKRYHFETKVKAMNDFGKPLEQLVEEPLTVFVCATTGQGDQPDNMMTFWRSLLKRTLPKDILNGHNFAVLGLGDSGYAQFNYAAKRLNRRLSQLGGHSIVNIGKLLCYYKYALKNMTILLNIPDQILVP